MPSRQYCLSHRPHCQVRSSSQAHHRRRRAACALVPRIPLRLGTEGVKPLIGTKGRVGTAHHVIAVCSVTSVALSSWWAVHLDCIHYNPVKHAYVPCPHLWPY